MLLAAASLVLGLGTPYPGTRAATAGPVGDPGGLLCSVRFLFVELREGISIFLREVRRSLNSRLYRDAGRTRANITQFSSVISMAMLNDLMEVNRGFIVLDLFLNGVYFQIFDLLNALNVGGDRDTKDARRNSFYQQPYVVGIATGLLTTRRSIEATMTLTRNCYRLERDDFSMDMGRLNAVKGGDVMFLANSQRRTQGIRRHCREGIRHVTRACGTHALATNITIRRANVTLKLINRSARTLSIRAYRACGSILNVIKLCFRRLTIVSGDASCLMRIVDLIQVVEGGLIRRIFRAISKIYAFRSQDLFLIILQSVTSRHARRLRNLFLNLHHRVNRAQLTNVGTHTARVFL